MKVYTNGVVTLGEDEIVDMCIFDDAVCFVLNTGEEIVLGGHLGHEIAYGDELTEDAMEALKRRNQAGLVKLYQELVAE